MAYRTAAKPRLEMIVEPETKVRFRYESEGGSHGGLMGKKSGDEKAYPTVKLINYNGKKSIYVKVSLYTEDEKEHVLQLKGPDGSVSSLTEKLKKDYTASFTNIKILSKKQEEVRQILMEQKLGKLGRNLSKAVRTDIEKKSSKEIKDRAKEILNSVRLCFEAFEEGGQSLCEPLFSGIICNQKTASKGDLRIHRMSKFTGSWKGGEEIILLCDKVQKDNIKIEFYEEDSRGIIWREPALFTSADVHYQVAITFKTPQYRQNTEKKVLVRLARGEDYSEPREFMYTPDFQENPFKKRKLEDCEKTVNATLPSQMTEINYSSDSSNSYNGADLIHPSETEADVSDDNNLDLGENFDLEEIMRTLDFENTGLGMEGIRSPIDDLLNELMEDANSNDPNVIYNQRGSLQVDCVDGHVENMAINKLVGQISISDSNANSDADSFNSHKSNAKKLSAERHEKVKDKVNSLLKKRDDSGNTLLHIALLRNKDITILLKANRLADDNMINVRNIHQETPLHIATKLNKAGIVEKLLKESSNPNLKNKDGNNCYHIASENDCWESMHSLLSLSQAYVPQIDAFNYAGLSPVHLAIKNKSTCFSLLKKHSANLSTKDKTRGRCLLHYAVEFWPSFVTTLLKDKGILMLLNDQDFDGNTPLHLACSFENIEVVKQLLKAGADPFVSNFKRCSDNEENSGETAFDITTNFKILEVLEKASEEKSFSNLEKGNIPVLDEVIVEVCKLLDLNDRWKCLAEYSVDEKFINSLRFSPSPTKALLDFIKKEHKDFIPYLKQLLEMAGLDEALMILKQRNI